MTWQLLPAREHFPAFADEWDRLNHGLYGGHPMFDSRFVGPPGKSGTDHGFPTVLNNRGLSDIFTDIFKTCRR